MENKREVTGWAMYDWANSAFSATVATTFLGPYLASLAEAQGGTVNFLGFQIEAAAFFPFCVSISVILQVLFLPVLGSIADYSNLKKQLMMLFAYTGATATIMLFFVQGNLIVLGGLLFIAANLAFGAAIVFYNAFLPDIAGPDDRDSVSSKGFAYGYVGGGLLLGLNLVMFNLMEDSGLAVRLSLASAGVWWLLFTVLFPQRRLMQREPAQRLAPGENYLSHSLKQLKRTLREIRVKYPHTLRFLIAYLIYNDGIQTVIVVSTLFASEELGIGTGTLVQVVLMIQFVASVGAYLFNLLAGRVGAKRSIMVNLFIWVVLLVYTYAFLTTTLQFWLLAAVLALILGGSQALSRSLFSQMIPPNRESEYFSFYEISERGTSWIGPLVFGLAVQITGTQRIAILSLIAFFAIGLLLLGGTNVRRAITDAGNEVPALI
ncbi:MAG: MFS transporter [Anaerolineae bacterium]